jgi:uncharacterized membrane protein YgaE (UPF0421/DUF939 family)
VPIGVFVCCTVCVCCCPCCCCCCVVVVLLLLLLAVVIALLVGYFAVTNVTFSSLYVGLYLPLCRVFFINKSFVNYQKKKKKKKKKKKCKMKKLMSNEMDVVTRDLGSD